MFKRNNIYWSLYGQRDASWCIDIENHFKKTGKTGKFNLSSHEKCDIFNIRFELSSLILYMLYDHGNGVVCNVNKDDREGLDWRTDTSTSQLPFECHFYYFHFPISQWSKHEGYKNEKKKIKAILLEIRDHCQRKTQPLPTNSFSRAPWARRFNSTLQIIFVWFKPHFLKGSEAVRRWSFFETSALEENMLITPDVC